ncbi:hypothetical protein BJY00DRAFT_306864 [Aspergillus carlsbadensis]|nr:hypothetical protein BJY00DRAFT_306864 [Aspergillus carlsbadensis]
MASFSKSSLINLNALQSPEPEGIAATVGIVAVMAIIGRVAYVAWELLSQRFGGQRFRIKLHLAGEVQEGTPADFARLLGKERFQKRIAPVTTSATNYTD